MSDRATYEFLRGKILDVGSEYVKESEDHLSKAVLILILVAVYVVVCDVLL